MQDKKKGAYIADSIKSQRIVKRDKGQYIADSAKGQYIAETATVIGDVTLGKDVGIWHHVTIRGDRGPIIIGDGTNVQDNSVLHLDDGLTLELGKGVTVGHGAILHGCKVGDNSLIGMGAIVMNEAVIGRDCVIGAGAVVTQGVVVPDGSLVLGCPGKVVRQVTEKEIEHNRINAQSYIEEAHEKKN